MSQADYKKYDPASDYAGAEQVILAEREYLQTHRENFNENHVRGLALSGGGIRSASFCLGVLQALASRDKLKKFDFLSTVSGGGYLGGALSWLWSGQWKDRVSNSPDFGVGKEDFPFGTEERKFGGDTDEQKANRRQASLLRHLRQNGKYLIPGRGINVLSFISIVLRSIVMGFVSLLLLSGLVFSLLYTLGLVDPQQATSPFFRGVAGFLVLTYLVVHLSYMVYVGRNKSQQKPDEGYLHRRKFESWMPPILTGVLAFLAFGAVHWLSVKLGVYMEASGGLAAALGALLGSINDDSRLRGYLSFMSRNTQLVLAAVLILFGMLVLADSWVLALKSSVGSLHLPVSILLAGGVLVLAKWLPINNISIHRYYRDRLMETFMPDVEKVLNGGDTRAAMRANRCGLHQLNRDRMDDKEKNDLPYHLINTNVILVESEIAKFRGRGGDNFILSPLYSGSNATGWRATEEFCDGGITLPSAVAISGAAANPDAGVAGKGLTTNTVISILMSIFNLRLGYWASNPDPEHQPQQDTIPSYYDPGFWEVLKRSNMNEKAAFVQLSDGGHFENLALYELFRRRARFILVCDAGADPDYQFSDLANALEKARVDFGVRVDLGKQELNTLIPETDPEQGHRKYPVAERSYLLADVHYSDDEEGAEPAKLVYVKTTLSEDIGADIHGYKRTHPDFPDQTTIDQFFDEVQFEAYRELGWQIGMQVLADSDVAELLDG